MRVLVDTPVWSLALRRARPGPSPVVRELATLLQEGRVVLMGPIRQEILSGLKTSEHFERLRGHLQAFPDVHLETADFEEAAVCFNRCRAKGLQGSNTDFLICAVAARRHLAILTTDADFAGFRKVLPLLLHEPRS